jgi:2-methylcitrate dehydratase
MSFIDHLSNYALSLHYNDLPTGVVEQAKWILVDTLACIIGGIQSDTGRICRAVAIEMGGPPEATIVGTGDHVSCSGAILANQGMLRYLDYNDCINVYRGPDDLVSSHPSGTLPVAFATAEQVGADGKKFIEAMVAGYEVIGRLLDSMMISLEVRGFHHSAVAAYAGAAMAGKLLRLTQPQLKNAMGIAGCMTLALNILDTDGEQNVMARNIVDGLAAERGLLAARLARKGLTGPENVIEGKKGFVEILLGGKEKFREHREAGRFFILDADSDALRTLVLTGSRTTF